MTDRGAGSELMVLQAIRLAGLANRDAILDRAFVADDEVDRVVSQAGATGWVEPFSFGDSSGWMITDAGSARLADLLRAEVSNRDASAVLEMTFEAFAPVNEQFVAMVSWWQLQSTAATSSGFAGATAPEVEDLLGSLTSHGRDLGVVLSDLIKVLPRFGRYPYQYEAALERARQEGLGWVTGVGLLSCHVVWAELHQDLFSTLGRDRLDGLDGQAR